MGVTPNRGYPYPEPTDPVAGGAQAIEDLAEAIDLDSRKTLGHLPYASAGFQLSAGWGSGLRSIGGCPIPPIPATFPNGYQFHAIVHYYCTGSAGQGADLTGDQIRSRFRVQPGVDQGISYLRRAHDDQLFVTEIFSWTFAPGVGATNLEVLVESSKACNVTGSGMMIGVAQAPW